ncbi:MAG TPA: Ig-like domain-containing protein [Pyrinomonadaceae bacterium]|jgi:hypothetical protein
MSHRTSILRRRNLRAYAAALISYLMLAGQVAPLALGAAAPRAALPRPAAEAGSPAPAAPASAAPASLPAPAAFAVGPVVTATKVDSWDDTATPDQRAEPGQTVTYTVTITNNGPGSATDVKFTDAGDPNTTIVPGSYQTQPVTFADTYTGSGNIPVAAAAPGVLSNDVDPDGNTLTVTKVQGDGTKVGAFVDTTATGRNSVKGSVKLNSNGSFDYEPPPGFEGADTFTYEVSDGTGKTDTNTVTVNISGMVWFIQNNAAGSLNRGTFTNPFLSIASFNAANTGSAPGAKPNDFIALRTGTGTYAETDGINLLNQQKLIGEAIQFGTVFTAATDSSAAYTTFANGTNTAPTITTTTGDGIDLAADNVVRGLNVGNTTGFFKIDGGAVGSPVINTVNLTGGGGALRVTTSGAFGTNVTFGTLESSSSPGANLDLTAVTGTLALTSAGTGFAGSLALSPAINIVGGGVTFTYPGNVTKNTTGALLSVSGGHNGTLTFNTGTLNASLGTGLQFNDADGTYNFSGTTTLAGGDAGVDITNGSGGTFTFNSSTSITSPTGTAFNVASTPGSPNVTYAGTITQNTTGQRAVNIDGTAGGSISIATVTAGSTAGGVANTGVNINAANGSVSFTTLNLGTSTSRMTAQAVTITGGSGAKSLGTVSIFTAGVKGISATDSIGAVSNTTGAVDTNGAAAATAVFIDGPGGRTPIDLLFTAITTNGVAEAVRLVEVSGTKFQVTGTTQINSRNTANGGAGVFVDSATTPTIQFATVNIPNPSNAGGHGFHVEDSSSAVTVATATIDNANQTVSQTDGNNDFIPDTDGDGDAIFLRGNTGSFTLNGGTLSNCGNDCIDVRASQNLALSGVTIDSPGIDKAGADPSGQGGHGIQAIDLTGTNSITNSTITDWETQARDGLRYIGHNSSTASTMTLHGVTFSNSAAGSNAILVTGRNSANMTLNVGGTNPGDPCTFSQVFGAAITHNAGDTLDSPATVNLNVRNNTFAGTPNLGQNTVSASVKEAGKATVNITGNTFDNVAFGLADNSGVIDIGGDGLKAGNSFAVNVSNNIIKNIGTNTGDCDGANSGTLPCQSRRAIDVSIDDNTNISGTIVIDGNNITNVVKEGIIFVVTDIHNGSDTVNARITNNVVGTNAAPVGTLITNTVTGAGGVSGIRAENFSEAGVTPTFLNVLIDNNSVRNGNGTAGSALNTPGIFVRATNTATMSATVTNNNVDTNATVGELTAQTNLGTTEVLCVDINNNTLSNTGSGGAINLVELNGTLNVEQSQAALSANNHGATVNIPNNPPTFSVGCTAPPSGPVGGPGSDSFVSTVMVGAPIAAKTGDDSPASKSAFSGGVTDRPFLSLPRTARNAPAAALVAPTSAANARAAARADGAAAGTQATNAKEETAQTAAAGAAPAAAGKNRPNAPTQTDGPGAPNGTGVGVTNFNIGTLPANDSVTITFQVVIDPTISATQISNQGQVSGSNFSTVVTDDTETVGVPNDATVTPVNVTKISVNNGKVAEPATGTTPLLFTVTLSSPAPAAGVSVGYATASGGGTPATAGAPATPCDGTFDYEPTSGTLNFLSGEQVKTVSVNVCSDSAAGETDETLLLNLASPVGASILTATATGTITQGTAAAQLIISELRTFGPGPANDPTDEFIELYNNTDAQITVTATDASGGFGVYRMGSTCNTPPVLVATIPTGTTIPARGHYLITGATYSLAAYGGPETPATGDQPLLAAADIPSNSNVAVFTTANVANISTANRLDAVGFGSNMGGSVCDLLREGTNLPAATTSLSTLGQYSYFRKQCDFVEGVGCMANGNPKDSNDNSADFLFADTNGVEAGAGQRLGSPGPENKPGPKRRDNMGVFVTLLDSTKPASAEPNRHRELTAPGYLSSGTLSIRRRVTNTTGVPVTRLRFRIVELTTFPVTTPGNAQLRAISSGPAAPVTVNDPGTCGGAASCSPAVLGTTLETVTAGQTEGGYNSTLSAGTITLGSQLQNNTAINLQFVLGIVQPGKFRFYIIVEALP